MEATAALSLSVQARAASLRLVRQRLAATLEAHGFDLDLVEAAQIAVNEACANAVRHAYPAAKGVVDVQARIDGRRVVVVVRDYGQGMEAPTADPGAGLGLSFMRALATRVEMAAAPDGGTEVVMEFVQR